MRKKANGDNITRIFILCFAVFMTVQMFSRYRQVKQEKEEEEQATAKKRMMQGAWLLHNQHFTSEPTTDSTNTSSE